MSHQNKEKLLLQLLTLGVHLDDVALQKNYILLKMLLLTKVFVSQFFFLLHALTFFFVLIVRSVSDPIQLTHTSN